MNRSRHREDTRTDSPPLKLMKNESGSVDNIDTQNLQTKFPLKKSTPISSSHHLSLLNQFKSHLNKNRKGHHTTSTSGENEDETNLSLPIISISVSIYFH
jgi:hypothetical protein